jgi:hypothetical protein
MEANGGYSGDRTLDRTQSLCDQTCPVSVQRLRVSLFLIGRGGASGHDRPDVSGCWGSLLDSNQTLALWRPVRLAVRPVTNSLERDLGLTTVSGPLRDQRVRSSFARLVCATSASGQRDCSCFKCLTAIFEGVCL